MNCVVDACFYVIWLLYCLIEPENFCWNVFWVIKDWKLGLSIETSVSECSTDKWLWEVGKSIFFSGGKLNVSVDYDRGKCQERVGENGTEIRLTVWILCAKWWKRKKRRKSCAVNRARPCRAWHGPCQCSVSSCWQNFGFCVFCAFSPISVLNWLLM